MNTLLIRLAGPLQSWGVDSKFERRVTENVPTKSALIGLFASAMGRRRNECVSDLHELRFGVRVDHEGTLLRDFHTAKSKKEKSAYVTERYYLSDALFLAGFEGSLELLNKIELALQKPAYPLFLGRRSCPPAGKILLGIHESKTLLEALQEEPWLLSEWRQAREDVQVNLRIILEDEPGGNNQSSYYRRDLPLSFDQNHRKYGFSSVSEIEPLAVNNPKSRRRSVLNYTEHDPMSELRMEE